MDYLGSNFDEFLSQRGQGPVFDFTGKGQTAKEVPEVVGQRKQLKPHLVVPEVVT
jgi:hypothetical protein